MPLVARIISLFFHFRRRTKTLFAKLIESTLWQSPLVIVQQFVKLFHLENSFTSLFREKDFSSSCFAGRSNSTSSTSCKLDLDWLGMFWKWQSHPIQSITLLLHLPNFFISLSFLSYNTILMVSQQKKSCLTKLFMGEETSHESYTRMSAGEGKKSQFIFHPTFFFFLALSWMFSSAHYKSTSSKGSSSSREGIKD